MARECADGHDRAMIHRTFFKQQSVPTSRIHASSTGHTGFGGKLLHHREDRLRRLVGFAAGAPLWSGFVGQTLLFRPSIRSAGF